jgi:hypothetical protein
MVKWIPGNFIKTIAFCIRSRVQRFRVQGCILLPGLHFGGVFMCKATVFDSQSEKLAAHWQLCGKTSIGTLAIMWQNQHFLRRLRVFNFVLAPNPER